MLRETLPPKRGPFSAVAHIFSILASVVILGCVVGTTVPTPGPSASQGTRGVPLTVGAPQSISQTSAAINEESTTPTDPLIINNPLELNFDIQDFPVGWQIESKGETAGGYQFRAVKLGSAIRFPEKVVVSWARVFPSIEAASKDYRLQLNEKAELFSLDNPGLGDESFIYEGNATNEVYIRIRNLLVRVTMYTQYGGSLKNANQWAERLEAKIDGVKRLGESSLAGASTPSAKGIATTMAMPTLTNAVTSTGIPVTTPVPTHTPTPTPTSVPRPTTDPAAIAKLLSHPWVQGTTTGNPNQAWNRQIFSMVLSSDHSTIYASAPAGRLDKNPNALFRSTDGGRTWGFSATESLKNGPVKADSLVFDPANPQIVYGANGQWRSEDGGSSWKQSPSVPSVPGVPGGPFVAYRDVLYAGEFRSTDRGETWRPFPFLGRTFLISRGNPSVLYSVYRLGHVSTYNLRKSTDGSSWEGVRILPEMEENEYSLTVFIIDYSDPPNIYVGTRENVFRANALDPKEWSRIAWPPEIRRSVRSFAVHPTNPDVLAISVDARIFVTFDGGSSWVELPKPEYMIGNVIYQAGAIELVVTGGVDPKVCVGTLLGVWCHDLSLE